MVKLRVNNKVVIAKPGSSIIVLADYLGISIPRLCYHPKLSISAHCGLCAVEIANYPELVPACATLVQENMQIYTHSSKVLAKRQSVLGEMLNQHPLDCPICEKSGQCGLQDLVFRYGEDKSGTQRTQRANVALNLSPALTTKMHRCVACTRCVRFSAEIAGDQQLTSILHEDLHNISIGLQHSAATSGLVGNMIDLCPVGAIVAKSQEHAKPWEVLVRSGISMHDSLGSKLNYQVNYAGIIKAVVRVNTVNTNEMWLSDRDRFGFLGMNATDRLKYPLFKQGNNWQVVTWEKAFAIVNLRLQQIISEYGGEQLGGLISPNATVEEGYYFQRLLQQLGSNNLDHRLHQVDFSEPNQKYCYPYFNLENISTLATQKVILLIGTAMQQEQPLAAMYIRTAKLQQAKIIVINPVKLQVNFAVDLEIIANKADLLTELLQLYKSLLTMKSLDFPQELQDLLTNLPCNPLAVQAAKILSEADPNKVSIILGFLAGSHPQFTQLMAVSHNIAKILGTNFGYITIGANSLGLDLLKILPTMQQARPSNKLGSTQLVKSNTKSLFQNPLKSYILFGIEPELDSVYATAVNTLKQAEFVVACTAFESASLMQYADLLLPISLPPETGGTYVNVTGTIHKFTAIASKPGESKAGSEVLLRIASNYGLQLSEINIVDSIKIMLNELKNSHLLLAFDLSVLQVRPLDLVVNNNLIRIAPIDTYAVDPVVRRSISLQQNPNHLTKLWINDIDAKRLQLHSRQKVTISTDLLPNPVNLANTPQIFSVQINSDIPAGCVLLPQINLATAVSLPYQQITLKAVKIRVSHD